MRKSKSKKGNATMTKSRKNVFSRKHANKVKDILLQTIISNM